jgi:zinc transport system permease protein
MLEALEFQFVQNALVAGFLASIACGILGTFVVVNRIVFISGGIAHAAYGGVGLAVFLGITPLLGILSFSLIVALLMAFITLKARHRADTIIGVLWALGMAIGIILLDLSPGYNVDLMSYLFGSILTVPGTDITAMIVMDLLIVLAVGLTYDELVAMSYDEEFARIRGLPVTFLYIMLMVMITFSVVMVIRVVGLILVIALLSIPPYISERFARSMFQMMLGSVILSLVFTLLGLWLSFSLNLTSGATIILVAAVAFFLAHLIRLPRTGL